MITLLFQDIKQKCLSIHNISGKRSLCLSTHEETYFVFSKSLIKRKLLNRNPIYYLSLESNKRNIFSR